MDWLIYYSFDSNELLQDYSIDIIAVTNYGSL